jgi:oligopeptidase B
MGSHWYQSGKLLHKGNTFEDFASVATGLLERGYTEPHLMAGKGVSAGGLVCGAYHGVKRGYHGSRCGSPLVAPTPLWGSAAFFFW